MVNRKDSIIVALATFCLTVTLFMILPTRSNPGFGEYDPWVDLNDDGEIDIYDALTLSGVYGTTGTPIDKTELLLELQARIDSLNATNLELQSRVDLLSASVLDSQSRIDDLNASLTSQINTLTTHLVTMNTTIATLESRIATLESPGFMKAPAYDSGWLAIGQGSGIMLNHNLNTDPAKLFIYVLGNHSDLKIHQVFYGGDRNSGTVVGLYAYGLTNTRIQIVRETDDPWWQQVRVQIWIIQ